MEIATGYFARAKQYAEKGYALVTIAKVSPWFLPKGLNVYPFGCFAPTKEILALKDSPDKYTRLYKQEILSKLSPVQTFRSLYLIAQQEKTDKVILLCYESPDKFCHRHLVAEWLTEKLGQRVEECTLSKKSGQYSLSEESEASN